MGLLEAVVGLSLFILVLLFFLDLYGLFEGAAINDDIATDAAKAASNGPPGKLEAVQNRRVEESQAPYERAFAIVDSRQANLPNTYEIVEPIQLTETIRSPVPSKPFGGPVNGTITVTTSIRIRPKFIFSLFKPDPIVFSAAKTFPYSWVMESEMFRQ